MVTGAVHAVQAKITPASVTGVPAVASNPATDINIVASKAYVDRNDAVLEEDIVSLNNVKAQLEDTGTAGEIATVDASGQYIRSGTSLEDLTNSIVESGTIAGDVVGSGTVNDGVLEFTDVQLQPNTVETANIVDKNVTAPKIADGVVTSTSDAVTIGRNATTQAYEIGIDVSEIVKSGIANEINATTGAIDVKYDDTTVGVNAANELEVKTGGITTTQIADGTITTTDINAGNIVNSTEGISAASTDTELATGKAVYEFVTDTAATNGELTGEVEGTGNVVDGKLTIETTVNTDNTIKRDATGNLSVNIDGESIVADTNGVLSVDVDQIVKGNNVNIEIEADGEIAVKAPVQGCLAVLTAAGLNATTGHCNLNMDEATGAFTWEAVIH